MRRWLLILGGALFLTASTATPASASWQFFPFSVSPVSGPTGTNITARGDCQESRPGVASLQYAGTQQTLDVAFFGPGPFNVSLTNRAGVDPRGFPVELEVAVDCFGLTGRPQPFSSTAQQAGTRDPRIVTAPGLGPCGAQPSCRAHIKGFDEAGVMQSFNKYEQDWRHGATVAIGDVDGDHRSDVVVARGPEPGKWAEVAVFNPEPGGQWFPMDIFDGGMSIALGDVDGDGVDEVILGAGPGGGPRVIAVQFGGRTLADFYAYDPSFRGGVSVAATDLDGDGRDEIITGAGVGGAPHVRVFSGSGAARDGGGFYAYDPSFRGGVNVAGGHLANSRIGNIVTAPGPGGGPHVRTFTASGLAAGAGFYAYDPSFLGGVSIAVGDADGFGRDEIVTAPFSGGDPHVRIFSTTDGAPVGPGFYAYGQGPSGVRVAVAP